MATDPVQNLIAGGLPVNVPPSQAEQDAAIKNGLGGTADISAGLASLDGTTAGTYNLDQLYSPSLQKVLGIGIGYDAHGATYGGFASPVKGMPTGRDWVNAYYHDPITWNAVLLASGYYRGKEDPRLGLKADSYLSSFSQLLTDAAVSRKPLTALLNGTFTSYVDQYKSGKISVDSLMSTRSRRSSRAAKQPIRYSNPEDLKEQARAAALDTLGYVPDDDYLSDFVKLYHGMEGGYQKKMYAGKNGTEPGNPQVQAQKVARQEYQTEASSYGTVQAFDAFLGIIGAHSEVAGGQ